ncbi:MAG TPA: hypothetical protein VMH86_12020 [Rhizomicrobium sp.]|nr:hypothetical protein [Rhizomicrobium sp.]
MPKEPQGQKRSAPKPKFTDAERHARFVEEAHKAEASEDPKDFEKAFGSVTARKPQSRAAGTK